MCILEQRNNREQKMQQKIPAQTTIFEIEITVKQQKPKYEIAIIQAIDKVFTGLGENIKLAIYKNLLNQFSINKEQIPKMIERFASALESMFGESAKLLELKILEELQHTAQQFQFRPKNKEIVFTEWIDEFRKFTSSKIVLSKP